jgi:hypothetical protein
MIDHRYRRIMGALLGALLGLTYGLVSQTINLIVLPGYAFYQPPFGPWFNTVLFTVGGAGLGLISAWPADGILGTVIASGASAAVFVIAVLLSIQIDPRRAPGTVLATVFFGSTVFGMLVPLIALLRWAASQQEEARAGAVFILKRLPLPIGLLVLVGGIGYTSLYAPPVRVAIQRMDALIQAGRQAPLPSALPKALRPDGDVEGFLDRAQGRYTLEPSRDALTHYGIPHPVTQRSGEEIAVVARFESGWRLVCIFAPDNDEPGCRGIADRGTL